MKRSILKSYARAIAEDAETKSYDYWRSQDFPVTYEEVRNGREIQVEIVLLEDKPDYLHLHVGVSGDWLSDYIPACYGAMIRREE